MKDWFKKHYLNADPRTLAVTRIALALVLLFDLARRARWLVPLYTNDGLLPNHTGLWRPDREYGYSLFWGARHASEVAVLFVIAGAVYLCLLIGYRTRWAQVLSLLFAMSLQNRVTEVCNGGDYVLMSLLWWTVFLPLGRRFSVDALLADLRGAPGLTPESLGALVGRRRDRKPVVSLAVFAASLQLAVVYLFNGLHKNGETWLSGSAVHFTLWQDRIATPFAVWLRGQMTEPLSQAFSWSTLFIELSLPVLILSPIGKPWTRRLAILFIAGLHLGISVVLSFGVFSWVMIAFSMLLLTREDFRVIGRLARRKSQRVTLYYDAGSVLCARFVRVLVGMDSFARIRPVPSSAAELGPDFDAALLEQGFVVEEWRTGRILTRGAGVSQLIRALPLMAPFGALLALPGLRHALDALSDRVARRRVEIASSFGWDRERPFDEPAEPRERASRLPAWRREWRDQLVLVRETAVFFLMLVAGVQVLVENRAVPKELRPNAPTWQRKLMSATRLQQGWSMFAPDAPVTEHMVVVDAVTEDGRHIDPYNELLARHADPALRTVPARVGYDQVWVSYTLRIPKKTSHHGAFREWILKHHERTGRAEDRVVSFRAFHVERDSPELGQHAPAESRAKVFLAGQNPVQRRGSQGNKGRRAAAP